MAHPLDNLDDDALDALPFGVVCLDEALQVVRFNRTEAACTGIQRWRALGRRYFDDVAPRETDRPLAEHVHRFRASPDTACVVTHTFQRRLGRDATRIELSRSCDRNRLYLCIHRDDHA